MLTHYSSCSNIQQFNVKGTTKTVAASGNISHFPYIRCCYDIIQISLLRVEYSLLKLCDCRGINGRGIGLSRRFVPRDVHLRAAVLPHLRAVQHYVVRFRNWWQAGNPSAIRSQIVHHSSQSA